MLPAVSMMSKCTVSPRTSPKRPTVGSPAPMAPTASRLPSWRRSFTTEPNPSTEPGMKSSDALLAVAESKFGTFSLQMNEFRSRGIEPVEFESLQQRELLQHHGALAPDPGLADGVAAIVVGQRRSDGWLPARHVVGAEHAAMRRAADVHDLLRPAELIDRLGDKAMRPGFPRPLDLRDAVGACALGFLQDAGIRFGKSFVC